MSGGRRQKLAGAAGGLAGLVAGVGVPVAAQDCVWAPRTTAAPSSLQNFRAVFVAAQNRTLLVGGPSPMQVLAWDQNGWSTLTSGGPDDRTGHAIAYDTNRGRLVLFAGRRAAFTFILRDTWEWDGAMWMLRSQTGPEGRYGHAMVYDAARGRCVMFGGIGIGTGPQPGTWEWDGNQWAMITTQGPEPRDQPSMVYDSDRARTVLFGGSGIPYYMGDTWEWDGAAWTQRSASGPPPRFGAQFLYDAGRRRAVLFGGPLSASFADTWELDGATGIWELRAGAAPAITADRASAFDSIRGVGVAFESGTNLWEWRGAGAGVRPWITGQPPSFQAVLPGGAASIAVTAAGSGPISYQWRFGSSLLANGGSISGADAAALHIDPVTPADYGVYSVVVSNPCGSSASANAVLNPESRCYPNCDASWIQPFLNVLDFGCYLGLFAAGDTRANCDESTTPPILNVLDFGCFVNAFAAGCTTF